MHRKAATRPYSFSVAHNGGDKLGNQLVLVLGIRDDHPFGNFSSSRHNSIHFIKIRKSARLFWPLGAVFGTPLSPAIHTQCIQRSTNDMITDTRQILDTPAPDQHHRVLLKVMPDSRDIGRHFNARGQTDPGHFAQRRVGFFRCRGIDTGANASFLRCPFKGRVLVFSLPPFSGLFELAG
jgi:hypothetical protein